MPRASIELSKLGHLPGIDRIPCPLPLGGQPRERVLDLIRRYGAETVKGVMKRVVDNSERSFLLSR